MNKPKIIQSYIGVDKNPKAQSIDEDNFSEYKQDEYLKFLGVEASLRYKFESRKDKITSPDVVELLEYGTKIRGSVLTKVIALESALNLALAQHFCRGNEMESTLIEMVFATKRVTFDHKREILNGILKKYYGVESTVKGAKTISNKIKDVAELRNIFAHYPIAIDNDSISDFKSDKTLNFLKYSYSETKEKFTQDRIEKFISTIKNCHEKMLNIQF
jgi:hypothetical protein